jgi:DNA-binding transcriptional LysR family regulator
VRRVQPTLPDLTIRQLEYLVAIAEEPTWAVAAQRVGVSPSALSQGLAELERRLGVTLFESAGRRRVLRDVAAPVLDHARRVLALTTDLVDWSSRVRGARHGRARVGMIDIAAMEHCTGVIAEFRSERPDVALTLSVAPSAELLQRLGTGELDLVVCVEPPAPPPGIEIDVLLHEPLVVVAPPGATIGQPATWGPWVTFPTGSHTRRLIFAALARLGAPTTVAAESHQPEVLLQMVELGLGWTVLPAPAGRPPGPLLVERVLVLARRAGSIHDPAADELALRLLRRFDRRVASG